MKISHKTNKQETTARLRSVHPGRILRTEILKARGITQSQLAAATGLPVSRINDLVKERRGITVDGAIRLGRALGTSTELWLNLQRRFDMDEAMEAKADEYDSIQPLRLDAA